MNFLADIPTLQGRRVLLRVDFNILFRNGELEDDTRIRETLPTIHYLRERGAKVIILTHIGRPDGRVDEALRTGHVAARLAQHIDAPVHALPEFRGPHVEAAIADMQAGDVLMLENIRFSPEEKNNAGTLAHDLASLADLFVFDAFAVAHRAEASVVGVTAYLPSYGGFLIQKEMEGLSRVLTQPERPLLLVVGGVKVETKIPVLEHLGPQADRVLIGGGVFNAYLKASGYDIGNSVVDDALLEQAYQYCSLPNVVRPMDVVVGAVDGSGARAVRIDPTPGRICGPEEGIYDIGPETMMHFGAHVADAKTIVWSGSLGLYSQPPYYMGTRAIAGALAQSSDRGAFSVVGGGDTLNAIADIGAQESIGLISTGGGAMLEFLAGKTLPGIAALEANAAEA